MNKYFVLCASFFLFLIFGCKPGVPNKYIQPDKLENILYDLNLAKGITASQGVVNNENSATTQKISILKKNGVSEADFDSSIVFYMRHADVLQSVYDNILRRLDSKRDLLEHGKLLGRKGNIPLTGDSIDIWNFNSSICLMPNRFFNCYTFATKTDSTYKDGDELILSFEAQFLFQEGMRDAMGVLNLKFKNDSVAVQKVRISTSSIYRLIFKDDFKKGIKEIKGYFILCRNLGSQDNGSILQLLCIRNLQLLRTHEKETDIRKYKKKK